MSEIKGEILIKGGFIIDPAQKIDGDVGDIAIKDGKIVEKVSNAAKVIDAKGKVVMAGGVDVHSHVGRPQGKCRPADPARRQALQERRSPRPDPDGDGILRPERVKDGIRLCPYGVLALSWKRQCPRSMHPTCTKRSTILRLSMKQRSRSSGTTGLSWSISRKARLRTPLPTLHGCSRPRKDTASRSSTPAAPLPGHGA